MKKRTIIIVVIWALFLGLVWPFREKAHADVLTAGAIGAASYSLLTDWGINFTAVTSSGSGMQEFMEGQIQDYSRARGKSLAELFGAETLKIIAGKLVIGQTLYNGIIDFKDWLVEKFNITDDSTVMQAGTFGGQPVGTPENLIPANLEGNTPLYVRSWNPAITGVYVYYDFKYNDITIQTDSLSDSNWYLHELDYANCYFYKSGGFMRYKLVASRGGFEKSKENTISVSGVAQTEDTLNANFGPYYVEPTVLNPDKEWTGLIGGQEWPDTNLDQLIGNIYDNVADNNLTVDGEIIDVPVPPTPIPTLAPDIPLQDVPWEGLNDLINTNTESLTNSVEQAADDITAAVDSTTEAVQSLENTITETLQPQEIEEKKFDLKLLFPFCIPFDIHNLLQKFQAEPVAPHVQLPFVIQSIGFSYTFDLDFSAFDSVAAAMRTVEFIVFAIGLAWATSKVIKW